MQLNILRADPAGNITVFVLDEVEKSLRAEISSKIMAIEALKCEQVGFLTKPLDPACQCRLEMMGGEFCGNASRALALYLAKKQGKSGKFMIEVSGMTTPIEAWADLESGTAFAQMPKPKNIEPFIISGIECTRVDLDGISHLVAECENPNKRIVTAADALFGEDENIAAYGMIFFNKYEMSMIPYVKVKATDSLVREGSCGSGTVAVAASIFLAPFVGKRTISVSQPSGVITAEITKQEAEFYSVSIGGAVTLGEVEQLDI